MSLLPMQMPNTSRSTKSSMSGCGHIVAMTLAIHEELFVSYFSSGRWFAI